MGPKRGLIMRNLFFACVLGCLMPISAAAQTYVRPYVRSDGTPVQGHFQSQPDGNPYNNYSYPGNMNPYTGRVAPGNPETYLRDNSGQGYRYNVNPRPYRPNGE
jgi:hypothetical protein